LIIKKGLSNARAAVWIFTIGHLSFRISLRGIQKRKWETPLTLTTLPQFEHRKTSMKILGVVGYLMVAFFGVGGRPDSG